MPTPRPAKKSGAIRRAFTLQLKPNAFARYKKYHDEIWPELVDEIERCGIAQISTFRNGSQLFLYSEIYDPEAWTKLWSSKIHDEWAECMKPLMRFGADGKVAAGPVDEIFHLETAVGTLKRITPSQAGRKKSP